MFTRQFFRNQPETFMDIHDDYKVSDNINNLPAYDQTQKQRKKQHRSIFQPLHIKKNDTNNHNISNNNTMSTTSGVDLQPNTHTRFSTLIRLSKSSHRSAFKPIIEAEDPHNGTLKQPAHQIIKRSKSLDFTFNSNNNKKGDFQISNGGSIGSSITDYKSNSAYFFQRSSKQVSSTKKTKKRLNKSLPPIPAYSSITLEQCQKNYEISQYLNAASDPSAYTTKPLRVKTMISTSPVSEHHDLARCAQSLPATSGHYLSHINPSISITNTTADSTSPTVPAPRFAANLIQQQEQQPLPAAPFKFDSIQPEIDITSVPPAIPPRSASRGHKYKSKILEYELGTNRASSTVETATTSSSCRESSTFTQSRNSNFSYLNQSSSSRENCLSFESYQSIVSHPHVSINTVNTANNFTYKPSDATMMTPSVYTSNDTFLDIHDNNINTNTIAIPQRKKSIKVFSKKNSFIVHHGRSPTLLRNFINEDLSVFDGSADVDFSPSFAPPPDKKLFHEMETNSGYCSSVYSSMSSPSLSQSISLSDTESEKQVQHNKIPQKQHHQPPHKESKEKVSRLNLLTRFIYRKKTVD